MRLLTAHKILIASAVFFFAFFAFIEIRNFASTGGLLNLATGVAGLAIAIGFGLYLRTVFARQRREDSPPN